MTGENQKIALVTGASRGFGFAVAQALAAAGYHVIALARTVGGLEDLDDAIQAAGGQATLVPLDINDDGGLQRLCLSIFERWGGLDIWVHSAFFAGPLSPVEHIPEKDWEKSGATNIQATQRLIALIDPLLRTRPGSKAVLPVEQPSPAAPRKFHAMYASAKAAQTTLWDVWAAENQSGAGPKALTFPANPMPTALRARFYPGEDRAPLHNPGDEAQRLLAILSKT
jgi:NAD(P)-dependent dehydrogenase (short-subunit alcohol dehydrogenase family)